MLRYQEKIRNSVIEKAGDVLPTVLFAIPAFAIMLSLACDKIGGFFEIDPMRVFRSFSILYFCLPLCLIMLDWLRRERLLASRYFRRPQWVLLLVLAASVLFMAVIGPSFFIIQIAVTIAIISGLAYVLAPLAMDRTERPRYRRLNQMFGLFGAVAFVGLYVLLSTEVWLIALAAPLLLGVYIVLTLKKRKEKGPEDTDHHEQPDAAGRGRWFGRINPILVIIPLCVIVWLCFGSLSDLGWYKGRGLFDRTQQSATNQNDSIKIDLNRSAAEERYMAERYLVARMISITQAPHVHSSIIVETERYCDSLEYRSQKLRKSKKTGTVTLLSPVTYTRGLRDALTEREEYYWHVDRTALLERYRRDKMEWEKEKIKPVLEQAQRIGIFMFGISLVLLLWLRPLVKHGREGDASDMVAVVTEQRVQMIDGWIVVMVLLLIPLFGEIDLDKINPLKPYWAIMLPNWYLPQFVEDAIEGGVERRDPQPFPPDPGRTGQELPPITIVDADTTITYAGDTTIMNVERPVIGSPLLDNDSLVAAKLDVIIDTLGDIYDANSNLDTAFRVRFFPRTMYGEKK